MALFSPVTGFSTTLAQSMTSSQTTMVLSSVTVQGHAIVPADYGSVLYFTINPGASNMEVVKCTTNTGTTFTIDANGRGLAWYGETETQPTGYAFAHVAGEPVIISNPKELYNQIVDKFTDESIAGVKTFASYPKIATYAAPTADEEFAPKKYADDLAIAGAPDATTTVKGIVEEATQAEVDAGTAAGGTSARLFQNPSTIRAKAYHDYAVDSVGSDSYAITVTPAISAYAAGQVFTFKVGTANTGAATLAVNGLTAKALQKNGVALVTGDLNANDVVMAVYDGTQFQVIGCAPTVEGLKNANAAATTANFNGAMTFFNATDITGAEAETLSNGSNANSLHVHLKTYGVANGANATTQTIAHGLGVIPTSVKFHAVSGVGTAAIVSVGWSNGTAQICTVQFAASPASTSNTHCIDYNNSIFATCTLDATNITLSWTGNATGFAFLWEAEKI